MNGIATMRVQVMSVGMVKNMVLIVACLDDFSLTQQFKAPEKTSTA
jgi:hypothetical protein